MASSVENGFDGQSCPDQCLASRKLFETAELLELVLLRLDGISLLHIRGSSRHLQRAVDNTPSLRRKLFLDAPHQADNALVSEEECTTVVCKLLRVASGSPWNSRSIRFLRDDERCVNIPLRLVCRQVEATALCRKMFFLYPPVSTFTLHPGSPTIIQLDNPEGIRFGEVLDALADHWRKQWGACRSHTTNVRRHTSLPSLQSFLQAKHVAIFGDRASLCPCMQSCGHIQPRHRAPYMEGVCVGATSQHRLTPEDYPVGRPRAGLIL